MSAGSADTMVGAWPTDGDEIRWDAGDRGAGGLVSWSLLSHRPPGRGPGPEGWQTWAVSADSHTTRGARDLRDMQSQPTVGGELFALPEAPTPLWVPGPDLCDQHQLQPCLLLASQWTQPVGVPPGLRARSLSPPARSGPRCAAPTALVTRPLTAPHSTGLKTHTHLPLETQCGNSCGRPPWPLPWRGPLWPLP